MKIPRFSNAIGNIDDDLIKAAAECKRKKRNTWIKWGAMAACLSLCAVLSIIGLYKSSVSSYKTYVIDTGNGDSDIQPDVGGIYDSFDYFEKKGMQNKTITFLENEYTGEYKESETAFYSYCKDLYIVKNSSGVSVCKFGINSSNGNLVFWNDYSQYKEDYGPYDDINECEKNARNTAKDIASKFVANIDEYIQIDDEPQDSKVNVNGEKHTVTYYQTRFIRRIGDMDTSDQIWVQVTAKGTVKQVSVGDINAFDDIETVDRKLIEQSIRNKMNELIKQYNLDVTDYIIDFHKMVKLPDGKYYVMSGIIINNSYGICLLTSV